MDNNGLISSLGRVILGKVANFRSMIGLFLDIIVAILLKRHRSVPLKQLINQVLFIGVDAFLLTFFIAVITGAGISYVALDNMADVGASNQFGVLMVYSIICELGPFLTAVVVVGRSGSAFTTFLGNMSVSREIDALETMGIDPVEYLVVPAFLGMVFSLIALNFYFDIIAVSSSLITAKLFRGVSIFINLHQMIEALSWSDIPFTVMKSTFFGAVVAVVSSYHGFVTTNLRIVPRAVYRTVVTSTFMIIVTNTLFSVVYYVFRSRIS